MDLEVQVWFEDYRLRAERILFFAHRVVRCFQNKGLCPFNVDCSSLQEVLTESPPTLTWDVSLAKLSFPTLAELTAFSVFDSSADSWVQVM